MSETETAAAPTAAAVSAGAGPHPRRRSRRRLAAGGAVLGTALIAAGAFGVVRGGDGGVASVPVVEIGAVTAPRTNESLSDLIARLQVRLQSVPDDGGSWALLGLAYVQQAKLTVDPSYYPRAEQALARSVAVDGDANFLALAGLSALASARHDFDTAKTYAERGLAINDYSALLYGALGDAELQLGNYDAAFEATQRMVDLSPDTASLTRASYTWELRGELATATGLMQRAFDDAPTPAGRAFALVHLGQLAFNAGDPATALSHHLAALEAAPSDVAALAGRARSEAALGQIETALDHYAEVVDRAPEPGYIVEYADLLRAHGRHAEAASQYELFSTVQRLFADSGVQPDSTAALFEAEHGRHPSRALMIAEANIDANPFVDAYDAYAWALHHNGRDAEARAAIEQALELGTPSAQFHYHAGVIEHALGDDEAARRHLRSALDINPYFHPVAAPDAQRLLEQLGRAR
jgi:tetratricopeptide (TPR) repeat protein